MLLKDLSSILLQVQTTYMLGYVFNSLVGLCSRSVCIQGYR